MDQKSVLLVSAIASAKALAIEVAEQLDCEVELVSTRTECMTALRVGQFALLIIDESPMVDQAFDELIWKHSRSAGSLRINFATSGATRLVREAKTALAKRGQVQALAMRAAAAQMRGEFKSTVAGLLLQSELALAEPMISSNHTARLRLMVGLVQTMSQQLGAEAPSDSA